MKKIQGLGVLAAMLSFGPGGAAAQTMAVGGGVSGEAKGVFERVRPLVFQVKSSISEHASRASYGSAFVIGRNGILATNYHVVSQVVQEPKKYQLYLMDGPLSARAEILAIDVVHDLAVIHVQREFPRALDILGDAGPRQGEHVYSIGMPEDLNMAIIEGNFNGRLEFPPYESLHLSSPINHGMSGGPTVDRSGRVIGVNVAFLNEAQNISFAVPVRLKSHR
jgi:S1-C subfamily serine protease